MDPYDVPDVMVEAAALALWRAERPPGEKSDRIGNWQRMTARAVLAAGLSVCEMRQEWHAVVPADTVPPSYNAMGGWSQCSCDYCHELRNRPGAKVERRWVITTPAEPVKEK